MPSRKHTKKAAAMRTESTHKDKKKDTPPHPMNVCDGVWSSIVVRKDEQGTDSVRRHEWNKTSLRPYAHFKKLYGERKFSKPHSSQPMHRSFLDLPPELRNRVYRLALIHDPTYIELSAKTNRARESNGHAQIFHVKRYRHKIAPTLRLLRTCKQIQQEAASIFYGEHEFRFTSVRGLYILERFLFTMGTYNVSCLRKIAMHITISGNTEDNFKENLGESKGTLAYMTRVVHNWGLRRPHYNWGGDLCEERVKSTLEEHGKNLAEFTLIMPDTFTPAQPIDDPFPYLDYDFLLDPAAFQNLKVRLVRLHGGFAYYLPNGDSNVDLSNSYRDFVLPYHLDTRKWARRMGYEVFDVAYDKLGRWPVELKNGEEIREIEGDDEEADWLASPY
ncbi:uncharacterized protein MYCFIDRAFT_214946 [Pseudocercospora fijiensis CIRAD86]|uniref:DUF7730 domain-containing protein n=1 Tax=Pseudocercospora fijiensis (strain CIRAD86) TaxID=383855 RepID=M3AKJ4_PSEFD|nr:uncharacterized protein MYCFIDRAFT_214946 [Pseudocercospora fijiensis CIRAD86]EME85106.1 hypothetical protein MYCFIDRAFT_214946 [Pseudocercospora fijiensis CIRAD86]